LSRRGKVIRLAGLVVAAIAALVAFASLRVIVDSHSEYTEAARLEEQGEYAQAVTYYRRSLRWYAPGNPYSRAAGEALIALAHSAESRGDPGLARDAYQALRAGIMAARGITTPYPDLLRRGADRLEALAAGDAGHRDITDLMPPGTPQPWAALLALAGYLIWVGSALGFTQRALDREDRLIRSRAIRWVASFLVGLAMFTVGLLVA
jgi:hypothetical protein